MKLTRIQITERPRSPKTGINRVRLVPTHGTGGEKTWKGIVEVGSKTSGSTDTYPKTPGELVRNICGAIPAFPAIWAAFISHQPFEITAGPDGQYNYEYGCFFTQHLDWWNHLKDPGNEWNKLQQRDLHRQSPAGIPMLTLLLLQKLEHLVPEKTLREGMLNMNAQTAAVIAYSGEKPRKEHLGMISAQTQIFLKIQATLGDFKSWTKLTVEEKKTAIPSFLSKEQLHRILQLWLGNRGGVPKSTKTRIKVFQEFLMLFNSGTAKALKGKARCLELVKENIREEEHQILLEDKKTTISLNLLETFDCLDPKIWARTLPDTEVAKHLKLIKRYAAKTGPTGFRTLSRQLQKNLVYSACIPKVWENPTTFQNIVQIILRESSYQKPLTDYCLGLGMRPNSGPDSKPMQPWLLSEFLKNEKPSFCRGERNRQTFDKIRQKVVETTATNL